MISGALVLGFGAGWVICWLCFGNKMTLITSKVSKEEFKDDPGIDDIGKVIDGDRGQFIVIRMNVRKNSSIGWKHACALFRSFRWEQLITNPDFSTIDHNQARISVRLQIPKDRLKELDLMP